MDSFQIMESYQIMDSHQIIASYQIFKSYQVLESYQILSNHRFILSNYYSALVIASIDKFDLVLNFKEASLTDQCKHGYL